jgi:hypothetical protein
MQDSRVSNTQLDGLSLVYLRVALYCTDRSDTIPGRGRRSPDMFRSFTTPAPLYNGWTTGGLSAPLRT